MSDPNTSPGLPPLPPPASSTQTSNGSLPDTVSPALDVLTNLQECKLGGIPFPCITIGETGSQALVAHMYPNVDGARVEPTGRNPSTFEIVAACLNNIYPAANESWTQGQLFPGTYNILLNYCYQNSKPLVFQHPYYGDRNVYVHTWSNVLDPHHRDGVLLKLTLLETIVGSDITSTISSPYTNTLESTAAAIDLSEADLNSSSPEIALPGISFNQMMSAIAGQIANVLNTPSNAIAALNTNILQQQGLATQFTNAVPNATANLANGVINLNNSFASLVANANAQARMFQTPLLNGPVQNANTYSGNNPIGPNVNTPLPIVQMNRLYNALFTVNYNQSNNLLQFVDNVIAYTTAKINFYQAFNRIETTAVVANCFTFLNQLLQVQTNIQNNNSAGWGVSTFVVARETTLINLCAVLNQTIDSLLELNPTLLENQYAIPEASVISYYTS